jgi:hypothetical protein
MIRSYFLSICFYLLLIQSCGANFIKEENSLTHSTSTIRTRIKIENVFDSPPECGYVAYAGVYNAEVLDKKELYSDSILLYIKCKGSFKFTSPEFTAILQLIIFQSPLVEYQVIDYSNIEDSKKKICLNFF